MFNIRLRKLCLSLLVTGMIAGPAWADSVTADSRVVGAENENIAREMYQGQVAQTQQVFNAVRSALIRYYTDSNGWPTSLATLKSSGTYNGTYVTPYGTITGAPAGNGTFTLTLTLPSGTQSTALAKTLSSRVRGQSTASSVVLSVDTPTASVLTANLLSRVVDPANPSANTMETNINMGGNWLNNSNVNATQVNVATLNATEAATLAKSLSVGTTLGVVGATTLGGPVTLNSTMNAKGASSFDGTTAFNKASTFADTLTANGATALNGAVAVNGVANFSKAASFQAPVTLQSATFGQVATFNAGLSSAGLAQLNGGFTATTGTVASLTATNLTSSSITSSSIINQGDLLNNGSANIKGMLYGSSARFTGSVQIDNALTVTGLTTTGTVQANNGIYVGAVPYLVADASGYLYQRGSRLDSLYLGVNATAADSAKLGGVAAANYARLDNAQTFAQQQTFSKGLIANGLIQANAGVSGTTLDFNSGSIDTLTTNALTVNGNQNITGTLTGAAANFSGGVTGGTLYATSGVYVGAGKTLAIDASGIVYEQGTALSAKYLGINATAANSAKLGGIDAAYYARTNAANTFTAANTFAAATALNGGVTAGGYQVISADGRTLYQAGQSLDSLYLGKTAKAADSDLLDGYDSSAFARLAANNTFTGNNTFSGTNSFSNDIVVKGTGLLAAVNTLKSDVAALDTRVDSLEAWRTACRTNATSPACAIALPTQPSSSGTWTTLYSNATGVNSYTYPTGYTYIRATFKIIGTQGNVVENLTSLSSPSAGVVETESKAYSWFSGTTNYICTLTYGFTTTTSLGWSAANTASNGCTSSVSNIGSSAKIIKVEGYK